MKVYVVVATLSDFFKLRKKFTMFKLSTIGCLSWPFWKVLVLDLTQKCKFKATIGHVGGLLTLRGLTLSFYENKNMLVTLMGEWGAK